MFYVRGRRSERCRIILIIIIIIVIVIIVVIIITLSNHNNTRNAAVAEEEEEESSPCILLSLNLSNIKALTYSGYDKVPYIGRQPKPMK